MIGSTEPKQPRKLSILGINEANRVESWVMSQTVTKPVRWTISDIDLLAANEWKRYEIVVSCPIEHCFA